jgi:hypothetical protein
MRASAGSCGAVGRRFRHASGAGKLLRPDVGRAQIRAMRARSMSGPLFFAVTTPVAAFAPYGAQGLWVFAFPLARILFVWFFGREGEEPG